MGYIFTVGNAKPVFSKEYDELYAAWVVDTESHPDAPCFPNDGLTGKTSSRSPTYSAWCYFCKSAGIWEIFYDERDSLKAGHPGCQLITIDDLNMVRRALKKWSAQATRPPGFDGIGAWNPVTMKYEESPDTDKYDPILARLIWLDWWMDWALKNCETPAIQNT